MTAHCIGCTLPLAAPGTLRCPRCVDAHALAESRYDEPGPTLTARARRRSPCGGGLLDIFASTAVVGDCIEWMGSRIHDGYGRVKVGGKSFRVHRRVWALLSGPIPDGIDVLHSCDNPPCCNPDHLFLGTNQDNVDDRTAKGRHSSGAAHWMRRLPGRLRGECNGKAVLTVDDVRCIRARHVLGERNIDIARSLGVGKSTIFNVVTRRTWNHV